MILTLNSLAPQPAATTATDAAAVTAAVPAPEVQAGAAPAAFAQWLGLGRQADASALLAGVPAPATAGGDAQPEADDVEAAEPPSIPDQPQDPVLAAMSMPLMAPPQAPAFVRPARAAPADQQGSQDAAVLPLSAAELRTGLAGAALPPAKGADTVAGQAGATPAAPAPGVGTRAPAGQPIAAEAPAAKPTQAAAPALEAKAAVNANVNTSVNANVNVNVNANASANVNVNTNADVNANANVNAHVNANANANTNANAHAHTHASASARPADNGAAPAADRPADHSAAPAAERPAGGWGVSSAATASAPASARLGADGSLTLAGPPTAWRQTLHEALGERLNLQLTNRAEQAVIRLEPPMLGRVDIAIRHSAGTLEVTISATHGEVLRQLNAVSDNLRNDLAARQFSDVAVTVTQAPRSAQANPQGDAQGRGRQPGREEPPKDPGRALADAGDPASTFSLNGRA